MKVAELIEKRRPHWQELESLCKEIQSKSRKPEPDMVSRFTSLYRAACADLALAEAWLHYSKKTGASE